MTLQAVETLEALGTNHRLLRSRTTRWVALLASLRLTLLWLLMLMLLLLLLLLLRLLALRMLASALLLLAPNIFCQRRTHDGEVLGSRCRYRNRVPGCVGCKRDRC